MSPPDDAPPPAWRSARKGASWSSVHCCVPEASATDAAGSWADAAVGGLSPLPSLGEFPCELLSLSTLLWVPMNHWPDVLCLLPGMYPNMYTCLYVWWYSAWDLPSFCHPVPRDVVGEENSSTHTPLTSGVGVTTGYWKEPDECDLGQTDWRHSKCPGSCLNKWLSHWLWLPRADGDTRQSSASLSCDVGIEIGLQLYLLLKLR